MLVVLRFKHTIYSYFFYIKANRVFKNKSIINLKIKINKEYIIILFVNLDFGGFLIEINTIIVIQKISNIDQPVTKA